MEFAGIQNKKLYILVAVLSLLVVFVATGGGLTGSEGHWLSHWQHQSFRMLCHQDPSRSFWIGGEPMAVCSRCYGIYSSFTLFWLSIPLAGYLFEKTNSYNKQLMIGVIVLNLVDIIGNLSGFWQNTLVSRFLMGAMIGMGAVLLLSDEFYKKYKF